MSGELGVHKAVLAVLWADATLAALLPDHAYAGSPSKPAVYEFVGQADASEDASQFPYVVVGDTTGAQFDTDDINGQEHTLTLHVWDRYAGRTRCRRVLDALYNALHRRSLVVESSVPKQLFLLSGAGSPQDREVASMSGAVATVSPAWGPAYLSLPGISGNYASAPDSAAHPTGDIDIIVKMAMDDWTPAANSIPIGKWVAAGTGRSWEVIVVPGGNVRLLTSPDGTGNDVAQSSSAATGFVDGSTHWLRVTRLAASGLINYSTSEDYDPATGAGTWTPLGTADRTSTPGNIFDSGSPLEIGSMTNGTQNLWAGRVHYAEVRNGIDGPAIAKFDPFNDANGSAASFTSSETGELWTINTSGGTPAVLTGFPDATTFYQVRRATEDSLLLAAGTAVAGGSDSLTLQAAVQTNDLFCYWEFSESIPDADVHTQHMVTRFRIVTQEQ